MSYSSSNESIFKCFERMHKLNWQYPRERWTKLKKYWKKLFRKLCFSVITFCTYYMYIFAAWINKIGKKKLSKITAKRKKKKKDIFSDFKLAFAKMFLMKPWFNFQAKTPSHSGLFFPSFRSLKTNDQGTLGISWASEI